MIQKMKLSRFWRLSIGLLLLGIGQRLIYTGAVSPWAKGRGLPLHLLGLSLVALVIGLALVLPLIVWFYKHYRSDKRLLKLILFYFLSASLIGLIIGGLGQLLYDYTSFTYYSVRTGIWATSTIVQSILKLLACFGLVSIYKHLPIRSRRAYLWLPILGVVVVNICLVLIYYWLPNIGIYLVSFIDALVVIFTLYYFVVMKKENESEKAP